MVAGWAPGCPRLSRGGCCGGCSSRAAGAGAGWTPDPGGHRRAAAAAAAACLPAGLGCCSLLAGCLSHSGLVDSPAHHFSPHLHLHNTSRSDILPTFSMVETVKTSLSM